MGPNGAGKTTFLKLAAGLLSPDTGQIAAPSLALYCPQRTDNPPEEMENFIRSLDKEAVLIRSRLEIQTDWPRRWDSLSHGERKRAQIGAALWQNPDLLAVDEPTNHMDMDARRVLGRALACYPGVGLLVSHDRELLDTLCRQCLFLDGSDVTARPGGYSKGDGILKSEQAAVVKNREQKKRA